MGADNLPYLDHPKSIIQLADNLPLLRTSTHYETENETEVPPFWSFTCRECEEHITTDPASGPEHVLKCWPIRCRPCATDRSRVRRMLDLKDRIVFEHERILRPYVGFLTLNLKGYEDSYFRNAPPDLLQERVLEARLELYSRWQPFWRKYLKSNCAGCVRFFEWTERVDIAQDHLDDSSPTAVSYKVHPHLHVLVLQDKPIEITELRAAAIKAGFGNQIDMEWRKDGTTLGSVDYCLSYVKKPLQADGKNRQVYGCFYGKAPE